MRKVYKLLLSFFSTKPNRKYKLAKAIAIGGGVPLSLSIFILGLVQYTKIFPNMPPPSGADNVVYSAYVFVLGMGAYVFSKLLKNRKEKISELESKIQEEENKAISSS